MASLTDARDAKVTAVSLLGGNDAVNGIGIARGEGGGYVVKVNLLRPPGIGLRLPREINQVPVTWEVVGVVKAQRAG